MSGSATRDRRDSHGGVGGARARILARVTRAATLRDGLPHPGRLESPTPSDPTATFVKRFTSQGGEVAIPDRDRSPRDWLTSFLEGLGDDVTTIAIGADVPTRLQPLAAGYATCGCRRGGRRAARTATPRARRCGPPALCRTPAPRDVRRAGRRRDLHVVGRGGGDGQPHSPLDRDKSGATAPPRPHHLGARRPRLRQA